MFKAREPALLFLVTFLVCGLGLLLSSTINTDPRSREWWISTSGSVGGPVGKTLEEDSVLYVAPDLYTRGNGEQNIYFPADIEGKCPLVRVQFTAVTALVNVFGTDDSLSESIEWSLAGSKDVGIKFSLHSQSVTLASDGILQEAQFKSRYCLNLEGIQVTTGDQSNMIKFTQIQYLSRTAEVLAGIFLLFLAFIQWLAMKRSKILRRNLLL